RPLRRRLRARRPGRRHPPPRPSPPAPRGRRAGRRRRGRRRRDHRMSTPILELENVKVWFGGVKAVDGVDLRLEEGRLYGIIGPNGSGKTTLINAISRLTP